jgi:hypothetical protein
MPLNLVLLSLKTEEVFINNMLDNNRQESEYEEWLRDVVEPVVEPSQSNGDVLTGQIKQELDPCPSETYSSVIDYESITGTDHGGFLPSYASENDSETISEMGPIRISETESAYYSPANVGETTAVSMGSAGSLLITDSDTTFEPDESDWTPATSSSKVDPVVPGVFQVVGPSGIKSTGLNSVIDLTALCKDSIIKEIVLDVFPPAPELEHISISVGSTVFFQIDRSDIGFGRNLLESLYNPAASAEPETVSRLRLFHLPYMPIVDLKHLQVNLTFIYNSRPDMYQSDRVRLLTASKGENLDLIEYPLHANRYTMKTSGGLAVLQTNFKHTPK